MSLTEKSQLSLMISLVTFAIMYVCLIEVGGTAATIALVIYSLLLVVGLIGSVSQIIWPKDIAIQLGSEVVDGKKIIKIEKYGEYLSTFDNRYLTIKYWISLIIILLWLILFLAAGLEILALISLTAVLIDEVGKHKVCNHMRKNKDIWSAEKGKVS